MVWQIKENSRNEKSGNKKRFKKRQFYSLSLSLDSDFMFLFLKHIEVIIPYQEVRERSGCG